ncbi:hypothetical protein KY290_030176 [Solanum tuberosum]|uniref:Uncharacterized protein n=1 Tax=Solanum tuberosum TaxID=4113 RepID=A0ABQ7UMU8_SOLTU|nr:hypothetical protein KY290_030176 [Solanum tuberosum]
MQNVAAVVEAGGSVKFTGGPLLDLVHGTSEVGARKKGKIHHGSAAQRKRVVPP